ncbi:MAG: PorT family protein [Bacteroidales bacterium]|nr:PorT family protein [Bacteroidales bacterium]
MKIRIHMVIVVMLVNLTINAFPQVKPFRFGFKLAPDISWLFPDSEGYSSDGSTLGFTWGFLSDFALTENYFVSTGFGMDYMGGKLEYPHALMLGQDTLLTTGELSRKYKFRNLEVPLTLKMRTNKFGSISYFGKIGFGTSFNIKSKADDEFAYYINTQKKTEDFNDVDIKDEITFMRASMIFGAGIEYFIDESTSLILGIDFNSGLTNVLKNENVVDPGVEQKANLNYFQLNIGVLF